MPESLLARLSRFVGGNPSVKKVADDPQLTSELILLARMMLADGQLKPEELAMFKSLCASAFGLSEQDIPKVIEFLRDYGYETTVDDAAAMFRGRSMERRKELLLHLLAIAKSDNHLDASEADLIRRTAAILELTPQDLAKMRKG